jgi:hypothetical protein
MGFLGVLGYTLRMVNFFESMGQGVAVDLSLPFQLLEAGKGGQMRCAIGPG